MREQTQFNHIVKICNTFDIRMPLHHYIKNYFRANKQLGSRDRKLISAFVYNFYRIGKAFDEITLEQKIFFSNFILQEWNEVIDFCNKEYNSSSLFSMPAATIEKIGEVEKLVSINLEAIFPYKRNLSEGVDYQTFLQSFLKQPLVWIRVRQGFLDRVIEELKENKIDFIVNDSMEQALGFKSATKLSELESFEKGLFEIQDLSSQKTISFFPEINNQQWWDCCAGAGGKSLMLADTFPEINLLLSDTRKTILENAKQRLKKAGFLNFQYSDCNLMDKNKISNLNRKHSLTDVNIVCDVPCSGSGTWARTPENLWNFSVDKIEALSVLQKDILKNICSFISPGNYFVFITCSVFKKENEDNVNFITSNFPFKIIKQGIIKGYNCGADTMFAALFKCCI